MRIQTRLLAILLCVAVLPVAVSGGTAVVLSRRLVREHIAALHVGEARHLAERVDGYVSEALRLLRLAAEVTPLLDLDPAELRGALSLVYGLHDQFDIVSLVDEKGEGIGPPVYASRPGDAPGSERHHRVSEDDVQRFAQHVPLQAALAAGAAVGPVYTGRARDLPLVVVAVSLPHRDARGLRAVLAVELALQPVVEALRETASRISGSAFLVDSGGRLVAHSDPGLAAARVDLNGREPVRAILGTGLDNHGMVSDELSGVEMAAAFARLDRLPWGVVVERPAREVFAPAVRIARQTAFWIGVALVCALAAGVVLARGIGDPIAALDRTAQALASGDLNARARVSGDDELGRLARTFNEMAEAIARRDEELRRAADELKARVDERTRELRAAQEKLLQSEKLAAAGELGAEVVASLRRPLADLASTLQLLILRSPPEGDEAGALRDMERQVERMREVVQGLEQLARERRSAAGAAVDVNRVVEEALREATRAVIARRVRLSKELAPRPLLVRLDRDDLRQVLFNLVDNAVNAMPSGGELRVCTELADGRLARITVSDTGIGIRPEDREAIFEPFFNRREDWEGKGLGLAVARRIVERAGGSISVDSVRGRGATFTVVLPAVHQAGRAA